MIFVEQFFTLYGLDFTSFCADFQYESWMTGVSNSCFKIRQSPGIKVMEVESVTLCNPLKNGVVHCVSLKTSQVITKSGQSSNKQQKLTQLIYRISSYSFLPWIVSAPLCTVAFGLMYCDLNYMMKYGISSKVWLLNWIEAKRQTLL